ncbi:MAG TPA: lysophospholipid acyltransferase family protein [Candidatus Acidoferrales bacterium]|nr:lysophospholipid acyltransferase family protein [Candidatus Acidoferrales bacterium]
MRSDYRAIRFDLYYTRMPEQVKTPEGEKEERLLAHYDTRLPKLTLAQRLLVPVFGWVVWAVIRILGPTIRFEVLGGHKGGRDYRPDLPPNIFAFWHRCIVSATWYFRNRHGVLMNTTNFDGQWTRRVIERLGYGTAQGSSTRGGLRGLAVMARELEKGFDSGFTIDGPRGPRYVAKPGPVMLARRSGRPIVLFHIGLEHAWTLRKSWDLMQIPKPFTRAVLVIAPPLYVPNTTDREGLEQKHQEMQKTLERVRDLAESWFSLSDAERENQRTLWNK